MSRIDLDAIADASLPSAADAARQPTAAGTPPPEFVDWLNFFDKPRTEHDWLIEPVIARGRGHSLFAKHGTGKSLFSLWLATQAVAAGNLVFYVDYEMTEDDLYERLVDMGCDQRTDLSRLRYLLLPAIAPLDTPTGAAQLLDLVDREAARFDGGETVVFIDTISRAVVGEENGNDTFQDFYRHTGLPLKQRGITWFRLDHEGHEPGHARGASSKGDDVDVAWQLSATADGIKLARKKGRMGWVPESVVFKKRTDPLLTYEHAPTAWPVGTYEAADQLARLGVDPDASTRVAVAALREAGCGRRREVVVAAQKYRRGTTGTTAGTTPTDPTGNHKGNHPSKPHNQGTEPPSEPPGTTPAGHSGTTRGVPVGTPGVPSPAAEPTNAALVDWLRAALAGGELTEAQVRYAASAADLDVAALTSAAAACGVVIETRDYAGGQVAVWRLQDSGEVQP